MKNDQTIFDVMEHGLSVPPVQRDYVMGRPDPETKTKLKKSLKFFCDAIFNGKPDPLYFVYGMHTQDGSLMLLDGQQRLTTLILVAWFCDENMSVVKDWKIKYASRRTANYFLDNLLKTPCLKSKRANPWECVKASSWYLPDMVKDATVASIREVIMEIGRMYVERKEPEIPDLREALRRITFSVEGMGDLGVDERSYDQIFLKMNARGLPLTPWEKMKSILDRHATDEEWKKSVDAEWTEKMWDNVAKNNINNLDRAMTNVVRMAFLHVDAKNRQYNFELDDLDEWLSKESESAKQAFWDTCRRYFLWAIDPSFARQWPTDRAQNALWVKEKASDSEFVGVITGGSVSEADRVRFDIMCSDAFGDASERNRRICLNLIDSVSSLTSRSKDIGVLSTFLSSGNLESVFDAICGVRDEEVSLSRYQLIQQVRQEVLKSTFPADAIRELESDPLVYRSQVDFLLYGEAPKSFNEWMSWFGFEELNRRLKEVRESITSDWAKCFCDILNNLRYPSKERTHINDRLVLPYQDEKCWGQEVLNRDDIRDAIKALHQDPCRDDYPYWVHHLKELIDSSGGWIGGSICDHYGWVWVHPSGKNWMPNSIRLDRSKTERTNRLNLLPPKVTITKSDYFSADEEWVKGVSREDYLGMDVFYNVNDESWWKDTEPYIKPTPVRQVSTHADVSR